MLDLVDGAAHGQVSPAELDNALVSQKSSIVAETLLQDLQETLLLSVTLT